MWIGVGRESTRSVRGQPVQTTGRRTADANRAGLTGSAQVRSLGVVTGSGLVLAASAALTSPTLHAAFVVGSTRVEDALLRFVGTVVTLQSPSRRDSSLGYES